MDRHLANYVRHCFGDAFGFDARVPLADFKAMVAWVWNKTSATWPYSPKYPSIRVDDPEWNPETYAKRKNQAWTRHVEKLAQKHLSPEDYVLWKARKKSA